MPPARKPILFMLVGAAFILTGIASWRFGWDLALHRLLRLSGAPSGAARVVELSALGGFGVMGPIALAATLLLAVRRRTADAIWLFVTVASGRLLVEGLKLVVRRPRPPVADHLELVQSWSFPSSHSAGTMMTCLALAMLSGGRAPALAAAFAAAAVIGWSRVALAVHWPGDVLAGWGFGLLWLGFALHVRRPAHRRTDAILS